MAAPITAKEAARWIPSASAHSVVDDDPATVRSWALSQGYKIGEKGRVPEDIRRAYLAAHTEANASGASG
ncbi:Lsr2 family DNA-binding protein [Kitasatospora sp. P5_F3]